MINDSQIANTPSSTHGNSLQTSQSTTSEKLSLFVIRVLIIDDDPDITFTFKKGLEAENEKGVSNKPSFKVKSYNDPQLALSEFKPGLYDIILIDINMPQMDGIELSGKILELDANVKLCLVTAGESNIEVLRELYPQRSLGCYINKPVTIDYLVRRVRAEFD